jgi:hypothetical protein
MFRVFLRLYFNYSRVIVKIVAAARAGVRGSTSTTCGRFYFLIPELRQVRGYTIYRVNIFEP